MPGLRWDWGKVRDTVLAGHLLASNQPKNLTAMAIQYLNADIAPLEDVLQKAIQECRRYCRSNLPDWRIAKEGDPDIPSARGEVWRNDYWLPKAVSDRRATTDDPAPAYYGTVLAEYANADTATTLVLWKAVRELIAKRGLTRHYEGRLKLLPAVSAMESYGVTISSEKMAALRAQYVEESGRAGRVCVGVAASLGVDLVMPKGGVNASLRSFCFDTLKLPPVKNRKAKTDEPCLNKGVMENYQLTLPPRGKALHFVNTLLGKRSRDTAMAYMDGYQRFWQPRLGDDHVLLTPETCGCDRSSETDCVVCDVGLGVCAKCGAGERELDERRCVTPSWYVLHPSFNITGTQTTRLSSSRPNGQNISKKESFNLRSMFGPAPGRVWYSMDGKNLELRIPFYESGEESLIDLFERPDEPPYYGSNHLANFHVIYPEVWDKVEKEVGFASVGPACKKRFASSYYQWVKNGNFAKQYGAQRALTDATFRREGAFELLESKFTKLTALNRKYVQFANRHGYVETLPNAMFGESKGYPLLCTRTTGGGILPTVPLSYHVQGTAGDWMNNGMIRCFDQLEEWRGGKSRFDGHMVLNVHDEILFDFPQGNNLWRVKKLKELVEQGGDDFGVPTAVGVEEHTDSWGVGATLDF